MTSGRVPPSAMAFQDPVHEAASKPSVLTRVKQRFQLLPAQGPPQTS